MLCMRRVVADRRSKSQGYRPLELTIVNKLIRNHFRIRVPASLVQCDRPKVMASTTQAPQGAALAQIFQGLKNKQAEPRAQAAEELRRYVRRHSLLVVRCLIDLIFRWQL